MCRNNLSHGMTTVHVPTHIVVVEDRAVVRCSKGDLHLLSCHSGRHIRVLIGRKTRQGLACMENGSIIYFEKTKQTFYLKNVKNSDMFAIASFCEKVFEFSQKLNDVSYIACNSQNILAFTEAFSKTVYFVDFDGGLKLKYEPDTLYQPAGICSDTDGNFYIADTQGNCIHLVDSTLTNMRIFGKEVNIKSPIGLAYHKALNSIVLTETGGCVKILQLMYE